YNAVKDVADSNFVPSTIPRECTPIHINLVARHGTRSPTKKRMRELDRLATSLEVLLSEVKRRLPEEDEALKKIPSWLWGWKSPWKGKKVGGELIPQGEEELYQLGTRIRERFKCLFDEDYHPDIYTIRATQVPRASASAVSFGMGLFQGKGSLGPGQHRAFSVISESRASDTLLRFFDTCASYKDYRKNQEPAVEKLKEPILDEVTSVLAKRYPLNITRQETSSLWFLCKQEASLLNTTDLACGLFSPYEISLLEWTDDLEVFILKGYGKSINYHMGLPLLQDVFQSMEQAIKAKEEHHTPGSYEKARLRFAHAETVVPFSCLLGLFLDGAEFAQTQRDEALELPLKPPHKRNWRGSTVAPFAGNNILVLYSCPTSDASQYFVQVLHNEIPVPLPGCDYTDFCPFEVFKERVVSPHLKHDVNSICNVKQEQPEPCSVTSKFLNLFHFLFSQKKDDEAQFHKHKHEL
ncbi:hypothetical protein IFM89_007748, partial [Coptis chinensis]